MELLTLQIRGISLLKRNSKMVKDILIQTLSNYNVVLILMLIDLVTGVYKSLKKQSVKSAKLRNSLNKCIIYFVVLLIGGCFTYIGENSVSTIFVVFLCIVEGVSVLENLTEIFPKVIVLQKLSKLLKDKAENK